MATNVQEHTASIQAGTRIFWLPFPDDHLQKHLAHSWFYPVCVFPPPPPPLSVLTSRKLTVLAQEGVNIE